MDKAIHKANEKLNFVSQDKDFLRTYHLREMALSDWTTGINTATERGIEQGIKQGIEKGKIEIAINLLNAGDSVEKVMNVTGLTSEEVESLK